MKTIKTRNGVAVAMALIFATLLLLAAMGYAKLVSQAKPQNIILDERVKLEFMGRGLCDLAVLKFQMYPADFYAAASVSATYPGPFNTFVNDPSLQKLIFTEANTPWGSVNSLNVSLATMALFTENQFNQEVLRIVVQADYQDIQSNVITKDVVRVLQTKRTVITPF